MTRKSQTRLPKQPATKPEDKGELKDDQLTRVSGGIIAVLRKAG